MNGNIERQWGNWYPVIHRVQEVIVVWRQNVWCTIIESSVRRRILLNA
jgi:hypothetical protein